MKALLLLAVAAVQPAPEIRFVACPIYRDTDSGRKSGCWLADDPAGGVRYDIGKAPTKPDWAFAVLVEGRPTAGAADVCGGAVLDPVRVSVLDRPCPRQLLPAEGFAGRAFVLPTRNVDPGDVVRKVDPPPYGPRRFSIWFDHGRSFVTYQYGDWLLDRAVAWLRVAKPRRIVLTGYAVTRAERVSGEVLAERPSLARTRAERIRDSLIALGFERTQIVLRTGMNPQPTDTDGSDGLVAPSRRRVDIDAVF